MKCLGVLLDDGLTWKEQVQSVRKGSFAGLARLRRLKDVLSPNTKKKIYNTMVLPHLDYCSVVWQVVVVYSRQLSLSSYCVLLLSFVFEVLYHWDPNAKGRIPP